MQLNYKRSQWIGNLEAPEVPRYMYNGADPLRNSYFEQVFALKVSTVRASNLRGIESVWSLETGWGFGKHLMSSIMGNVRTVS